MEVVRKMFNTKYKKVFYIIVFSFIFSTHSVLAVQYGSGSYGNSLYSATIPGTTASPQEGTYTSAQQITLSTMVGNTIRYSTATAPLDCSSGDLYASPINITTDTVIYTLACDTYGNSTSNTFSYLIRPTTRTSGRRFYAISSILTDTQKNEVQELNTEKEGDPINKITTEEDMKNNKETEIPIIVIKLTKTLKQGMSDDEVKLLQIFLNKKGYLISNSGVGSPGNETNYFGIKTKKALVSFQKDNKLTPDGILGPLSIEFINKIMGEEIKNSSEVDNPEIVIKLTKTLKQGMSDNEVKLLQIFLNKKGYLISNSGVGSPGNETNYFGIKTKKALVSFQKDNKLTPDGILGPLSIEFINKII